MRQPADRHTVRNARANTSHPPAPRPHASSRDAQVATLCAPQRCTGRPGGVPGAPAAKHVTRQRHEPAALCGTNSKGDENWRDLFQREDQAGALSLQPTQVQRHGAAAPPGPRRARVQMHRTRPDRCALSREAAAARVCPGRSPAETRPAFSPAHRAATGQLRTVLAGRRRCWKRYECQPFGFCATILF